MPELLLLSILCGLLATWQISDPTGSQAQQTLFAALSLAGILLYGGWQHLRRDRLAIWVPVFWFRIAAAAYYGIGTAAPYFVNETTRRSITNLYNFSDAEALKFCWINLIGILVTLVVVKLVSYRPNVDRHLRAEVGISSKKSVDQAQFIAALLLVLVGGAVRYFVILPWSLGIADTVSGAFVLLGRAYIVGLFLLVLSSLRGNAIAWVLSVILIPIDLAVGLLTFSKTEVMMTLIFVYLGFLHHKATLQRIVFGLIVLVGVFSQLDPVMHFGRNELWRTTASQQAPLSTRLEIVKMYSENVLDRDSSDDRQYALARLSYVNTGTMVVAMRDQGQPGDTLRYAFVVLVPRAIWPEKPQITVVGSELYTAATNQIGSSISPGIFAEAYWNMGWLGVLTMMSLYGAMLAFYSRYVARVMNREQWIHLPAVLAGIMFGARVDGWLVSDMVGGVGVAFAYILFALVLARSIGRVKSRNFA